MKLHVSKYLCLYYSAARPLRCSDPRTGAAGPASPHAHLQEVSEQEECLLADEGVRVLQTHRDAGDVLVHHDRVPDAEVAQDDDGVVADGHIPAHLQLPHQGRDAILRQILVLQAQLPCRRERQTP